MNKELSDFASNGKQKPWKRYKMQSLETATCFRALEQLTRSDKIAGCSSWLRFAECPGGHEKKLSGANFCRQRLCPMCMWRKSELTAWQVNQVAHVALAQNPTFRFIFLTLTVPNVKANDLSETITHLFKSWDRLSKQADVKSILKGYFRTLEVKYNSARDDYHPHFHMLLLVPANYFTKNYIKQERWLELWRKATRQPEITQVDVRKLRPKPGKMQALDAAASEVAKYSVKPEDYLGQAEDKRNEVVGLLQSALHGRRLVAYGGLLRDIYAHLNLTDPDQATADDLVETKIDPGCTCSVCQSELKDQVYLWQAGSYRTFGDLRTSSKKLLNETITEARTDFDERLAIMQEGGATDEALVKVMKPRIKIGLD